MKLFTRLRLFLHVLAHGCRIVDFADLKCEGCKHEPICNLGYYGQFNSPASSAVRHKPNEVENLP